MEKLKTVSVKLTFPFPSSSPSSSQSEEGLESVLVPNWFPRDNMRASIGVPDGVQIVLHNDMVSSFNYFTTLSEGLGLGSG